MENLQCEIQRKRKAIADGQQAQQSSGKYVRRGQREPSSKKASASGGGGAASTLAASAAAGTGAASAAASEQAEPEADVALPTAEVKRRLRAAGEPITYFGETGESRAERLQTLRSTVREESTGGQQNNIQRMLKQQQHELLPQLAGMEGAEKKVVVVEPVAPVLNRTMSAAETVLGFFKRLVKEWEAELNGRSAEVKVSAKGKVESVYFTDSVASLKPLFKMIKKNECPADILRSTHKIVQLMIMREYIKAMEEYFILSIGNAPWPMGVTSVGIHARAARENIFEQSAAHVLNDDISRKYIHALKRLMIYCQRTYPSAPSKMFEFHKEAE